MKEYFLLERKDSDLPFYNYKPMEITRGQWSLVYIFMILAFLVLTLYLFGGFTYYSLPFIGFLGFFLVARARSFIIFKKLRKEDLRLILVLVIVSLVVASLVSGIINSFYPLNENPAALPGGEDKDLGVFLVLRFQDFFQLLTEEFLAIFPLLGLMQYFYNTRNMSRKKSLVLALLLSSVFFGMLHLPTYGWNFIQSLGLIGLIRIFFSLGYVISRNIWVSFLIHFIYDSLIFGLVYFS